MIMKPGVSVIIPVFAPGREIELDTKLDRLRGALRSLHTQTVTPKLFEVLIILNGSGALGADLSETISEFSHLDVRVFRTSSPGAGRARNLGISVASRAFLTFMDDDDLLEPRYLEIGLRNAHPSTLVLLPIVDVIGDQRIEENSLNTRIKGMSGSRVDIGMLPWALGFNACKIIPAGIAQKYRYDETLRSGEDVAYFANFLSEPQLLFSVPQDVKDGSYLRAVTNESVSRQKKSFDFSVAQRIETVSRIRQIKVAPSREAALNSLVNSQFNFTEGYLKQHPQEVQESIELATKLGVWGLPWESLRKETAKRLVFSYCFPPYSDTSANVTAKVIRDQAEPVDVFYANMSRVREKDNSTRLIVEPYIVYSEEVTAEPSFADWGLITSYAQKAADAASKRAKKIGSYESMYSRALWSGSHVAAALYKIKYPNVWWEAEFSDPLALGVTGELRLGELEKNRVTRKISRSIKQSQWRDIPYKSHFEFTELATLILADELIFTNENQLEVMVQRYPKAFQDFVTGKATIRHHVVPTKEMYKMVESTYSLDQTKVNIGYFGNFYGNRGLEDVLNALASSKSYLNGRVQLHIFTGSKDPLEATLWELGLTEVVRINSYVSYLEFLNLATKFDALVVNDTEITETAFDVNPFLPSKYSDYVGSGTPVWGICTENSPLSEKPLEFISRAGDVADAEKVIYQLLSGHE